MTKRILIVVMGLLTGCQGAPEYAGIKSKSDSELKLGWGRSLRLGAETDATLKGLKTSQGTTLDEITFHQSPAATMANGWVPAMDAYGRQQVNFVPILKQYGDNAVNVTNAVTAGIAKDIAAANPVATAWIAGHTQIAVAQAQRPGLVSQLASLVGGGQVAASTIKANDPAIAAAVEGLVSKNTTVTP